MKKPWKQSAEDCISRVRCMVNDDSGTWDLSENDKEALEHLLAERDANAAELTRLHNEMASLGTRQPDHFSVTADGVLWGGTDYDDIDDAKHHAEQFMKDEYRNVEVVRVVTFIQPLEIP